MVLVVLVALCSAACFAVGSSLQHRSAESAPTSAPRPPDEGRALVVVTIGVTTAALVAHRGRDRPLLRGVLLATASGVSFGLVAGLLKVSTVEAQQGVLQG